MSNTKPTSYKIITRNATSFDAEGYIQNHGVEVSDFGDSIGINASEFPKDELTISENSIVSKIGGWSVTW